MPIERMTLNIPDAPLKDFFTWLPRDGGKEDFSLLDQETESDRIICTHPSNPCILNTMIEMIENAQDNVLLCNWMLSHAKIESALARAAGRLNGRVHVLTTLETSVHSRYTDDDSALNDLSRLQKLAGEGVYIRLHPEAHAKFLIVDNQVLVTSANIRDTSLALLKSADCQRFQIDVRTRLAPRSETTYPTQQSGPPSWKYMEI